MQGQFIYIRALRHIWASFTIESSKTIAAAIVGSRLDFCNSLLAGTPVYITLHYITSHYITSHHIIIIIIIGTFITRTITAKSTTEARSEVNSYIAVNK